MDTYSISDKFSIKFHNGYLLKSVWQYFRSNFNLQYKINSNFNVFTTTLTLYDEINTNNIFLLYFKLIEFDKIPYSMASIIRTSTAETSINFGKTN